MNTKCPAANTPTSRSRPPAWAWPRWPEIARVYAEVNQLFGDIVKVTPSSKVVGDMAMFLITRGIKPADVLNLEPGSVPFPASVIDMLPATWASPPADGPKNCRRWCWAIASPFADGPAPV
jgi:pyruvate carboxylase